MIEERVWLGSYPEGVSADIDASQYPSLVGLMADSFAKYANRTAYSFMGQDISYAQTDVKSQALAAYFQSLDLEKGERVAIMMPNVPQYPVAVAAILRAGLVVVNVNPLYTPRELEFQLKDSGAKAIVIIENFAITLQKCIAETQIKHVVLCAMGDMLSMPKGALVNFVVRNVKSLVPDFELPGAIKFNQALGLGERVTFVKPVVTSDDIAVLQYTGGTTGVSKGAVLLHRNVIANLLQSEAWNEPVMKRVPANEQPTSVCALPLYHIFAFTVNMMLGMRTGGKNILIPNPRDLPAVLKTLSTQTFHSFPAVNTLFNGLANHPDFDTVNWKKLQEIPLYQKFGKQKSIVSEQCSTCCYYRLCAGCCQKNRFGCGDKSSELSILCAGWKLFYEHTLVRFKELAQLIIRERNPYKYNLPLFDLTNPNTQSKNSLCHCGSGNKFKKCCGAHCI